MKKLLVMLTALISGGASTAQTSPQYLSLEDAITSAQSQSSASKLAELQTRVAEAKYKQTDAIFLPQASVSYTASSTNNSLNAFGFKLQQQSISATDFSPKLLNDPPATPDYSAKIEMHQPILNLDMLYQRKAAASQVDMQKMLSNRTKDNLRFEAQKAYLQLQLVYDEVKVSTEALIAAEAVYENTVDYYKKGLIQRSDLLNAELHVMNIKTRTKAMQSGIEDASDELSILMGRPTGIIYTADSLRFASASQANEAIFSGDRADFRAMEKGMDSYDLMIRSSKMSYLPTLNAVALLQSNAKNLFVFDANSYFAGVQLSWRLFNGNRTKNTIEQLSLEKQVLAKQLDQQKTEAKGQINHYRRQLADALFDMQQQELAIVQASEALRVLNDRYAQGLAKTVDVLMAQTQLSQEKMGYVQAVFNYSLAAASLEFLTSNK